jgi:hypothetical protein
VHDRAWALTRSTRSPISVSRAKASSAAGVTWP